ncbi:hypothetical protein RND71_033634 [Anisodus tanguticus]|uniref:Uncharacterized protein n=1 Tax=Anisodus tanguticus TaxID=243964 RepID=A0AAE1R8Y8_9SOLA|nr:hypothetical protein RND71_033634 [Anisodus tanguticus]
MRITGVILFLFFFLVSNLLPCSSFYFPFSNYHAIFSLSHSLFSRVANLREARGDYDSAERARSIARKLENGLGSGFWKVMWNVGWDYARNYAWRDATTSFEMFDALSEFNEMLRGLTEFTSASSDRERVNWINRNYEILLKVSRSLFGRFRNVFRQSGPLKEVIDTLQKEVLEDGLLKDCLELGTTDLKGLLMVFKDISSKYTSTSSTRAEL